MNRSSAAFHALADILPEALMLVSREGLILDANAAAQHQFVHYPRTLKQAPDNITRRLHDLFLETEAVIAGFLGSAARTKSFTPFTLTHGGADGVKSYRAEAALFSHESGSSDRSLLLRLRPREVAGSQFVALNDKIRQLSLEIDRRTRAERGLIEEQHRKNEFLAMLGHELRNPLAPIKSALVLLAEPELDDSMRRKAIAILNRQADHLSRLVGDLLDVARISRGRITLNLQRLKVKEIVSHALELCSSLLEERQQRLEVRIEEDTIAINGDIHRLTQVFGNLLNNASKYSPAGSLIVFSSRRAGDEVEFVVSDQGVGIDTSLLDQIFEPFSQAERSIARSEGGLGLGLSIVRRLIQQHGGSVLASSEGKGLGSQFTVMLPAVEAAVMEAPSSPACHRGLTGRTILVVDDNVDAAQMLAGLLNMKGHMATAAHTGREAIAVATCSPPDLIFLDIGLPDISGYEVAGVLRENSALAATRLVALTGYGQAEDRRRALAAGFDNHLVKPMDMDQLEAVLAELP